MKPTDNEKTTEHVLVVLDSSARGFAALEAAASLAAFLRAELRGVLVEDANLLKLAALPFAREVGYAATTPRQLDAAVIRRTLRYKAEEARSALETQADRANVKCTFQVSQGRLVHETLAAGKAADLLVVGHQSRSGIPQPPPPSLGKRSRVVAFCPDTPAGRRTLTLAARISRAEARPVLLLFPCSCAPGDAAYRRQCFVDLREQAVVAEIDSRDVIEASDLIRVARGRPSQLILLPLDSELLTEAMIDRLACEVDFPVALVR